LNSCCSRIEGRDAFSCRVDRRGQEY
jgi:hypothetical protein